MKIIWLPSAQRDLVRIDAYYTEVASKAVANRQLKKVVKAARMLQVQPYLWHLSPNDPEVLEWHVANTSYTLPYSVEGEQLMILSVFDERQDKPGTWLG